MNIHLLFSLLSQVYTIKFLDEALKISLISLIAYTTYYYYKYFTRENPLPGPFPLPFIGNLHQIYRYNPHDVKKICDKYGGLCEYHIGWERCILVGDYDLMQRIMKPTIKGPFHNRIKYSEGLEEIGVMNVGLPNNNNYDDWNYHRRFFTQVLMSPKFMKQSVKCVQDCFVEMSGYWDKLGEDKVLEFNHWMKQYLFNAIYVTTTNKPAYAIANYYNKVNPNNDLNLPENVFKDCDKFAESTYAMFLSFAYFRVVPRVVRNFPGIYKYTKGLKDKLSWLENNVDEIIKTKQEEISKTPIDQELTPDILTMFLTVNTERDITERIADNLHIEPMSAADVRVNFMSILTAGIDTSSNAMCVIVDYLENNPKVKQKMIEEIERVLGNDPDTSFTYDDLSKFQYIDAVIHETFRLKPIASRLARVNNAPVVMGSYKWSKETTFYLNIEGIHFNKSYFKDPDTFNPDRFLEDPASKNLLYMFGGGLRKCPGRNLAMMEIKATLIMLYREYDIKLMGPIKEKILGIRTCEELKFRVRKRTKC